MSKMNEPRVKTAILVTLFILATIALSLSLSTARLKTGTQIVPATDKSLLQKVPESTGKALTQTVETQNGLFDIFARIFFWGIMPLLFLFYVISPGNKKRRLASLSIAALLMAAFPYIAYLFTRNVEAKELKPLVLMPTAIPGTQVAPPQLQPRSDPTLVAFVIAVPVIFGIFIIIWFFFLKHRENKEVVESIEKKAQTALNDISKGEDLRNVILRTYQQMSHILERKHGISRKLAMTPREFSMELKYLNFPESAVNQLTELFEKVRYGAQDIGEGEEAAAIRCLTEILRKNTDKEEQ